MPRKDWDKVADKEFNEMDADSQAQWMDLRRRLGV